jgi:hypothetical protein
MTLIFPDLSSLFRVVIPSRAAFQLDGVILSGAVFQAKRRISDATAPARAYLLACFAWAAARARSFAIVSAAVSLRFLFFCRRFALVT